MTFGNKLYYLRKKHHMSQEDLASRLDTSRQAVSKWENDKGFPETDTLLKISNLFNVTADYLLKDGDNNIEQETAQGYYANQERIQGFLMYERSGARLLGAGVFLLLLSAAPDLIFSAVPVAGMIAAIILITAGIGCIVAVFLRKNKYKAIRKEPLYFDHNYLTELRGQYKRLKRGYAAMLLCGIMAILTGIGIAVLIEDVNQLVATGWQGIILFLFAIGVYMLIYSSLMMDLYGIVTENKMYTEKRETRGKFIGRITFWHIIVTVILSVTALYFFYRATGGDGRIAHWLEKILSKL